MELISQKGYERLLKNLEHMKDVVEPAIRERISTARDHGDLSENAEYHAAREEMSMLHLKMAQIEERLSQVRIVTPEEISTDQVQIYTQVKVTDLTLKQEKIYIMVSNDEADFASGKISIQSPIGAGLSGAAVGDVVEIQVPAGVKRLQIESIERYDHD